MFAKRSISLTALFAIAFSLASCSSSYKDLASPTGRNAIMDDAINYLTDGNCEAAITTLQPLYSSQWVSNEVRMLYASAYACQGGVDFPSIIAALKDSPSDIWSPLVKANWSDGGDGKTIALLTAASIIRQTAEIAGSFEASARTEDANLYMIMIQVQIISTTISALGNASRTTGYEGNATWPINSANMHRCRVQTAVANIDDALDHVQTSGSLSNLSSAITTLCTGVCRTNRDPDACAAADHVEGLALMNGISTDWTGP